MDLKELMGKKKQEKDPEKRSAKMDALKSMRQVASDMMKDGMHDKLSKVSVLAKNPQDLEQGLDKAKDLVHNAPDIVKDAGDMSDEHDVDDAAENALHPDPVKMNHPDDQEEQDEDNHYAEADELIDNCDDPKELDELMQKIAAKKAALVSKKV